MYNVDLEGKHQGDWENLEQNCPIESRKQEENRKQKIQAWKAVSGTRLQKRGKQVLLRTTGWPPKQESLMAFQLSPAGGSQVETSNDVPEFI